MVFEFLNSFVVNLKLVNGINYFSVLKPRKVTINSYNLLSKICACMMKKISLTLIIYDAVFRDSGIVLCT